MIASRALLIAHVVAGTLWVGGVFMASLIDWPAFRASAKDGRFPFDLVVGHGRRIFPAVYSAIILLTVTGIGLLWTHPPGSVGGWTIAILKAAAFAVMVGFTGYGTLFSWPRLQLSTSDEAFKIYGVYIARAYVTFACGLLATVLGVVLSHFVEGR